jgi:hypothetical protein
MAEHIAGRARNADKLDVMEEHMHSISKVYPTLTSGVSVLSGAAWTLGNFVELIPVDTITSDFDIHWLVIESTTDDEVYELVFYNVETEISRVRFATDLSAGNFLSTAPISTLMQVQPKNSQIQVKLASSGAAETAVISVLYHTY